MVVWWLVALAGAQEVMPWAKLGAEDAWVSAGVRQTDVGEITIATQRIGGQECLQGKLRTTVGLAALHQVLNDPSGDERWRTTQVAVSETLLRTAERVEFYQVMDVPDGTMAADRWWLLRAWSEAGGTSERRFRWQRLDAQTSYPAVHASVQERFPGAVEMPVNWGEWVFRDLGAERDTTYRVCTDLGGSLPSWIQRMATQRTLPDNLVDLVREARRRSG